MPKIMSLDELHRLKVELVLKRNEAASRGTIFVTVGTATCGIAAGALEVLRALESEIENRHLNNVIVTQTGCIGLCRDEPILEVVVGKSSKVVYGKVIPDMVKRIVQEHILGGHAVPEYVIDATPFPTI